jgi:hypothetical protein
MTTQRYIEIYEDIYQNKLMEYMCEIATNIQEAKKLLEQEFRYETGNILMVENYSEKLGKQFTYISKVEETAIY